LKVSDPGKVEGNMVFTYLDAFDEDKKEVAELKKQYCAGGLGDTVIKKRLLETLENLIAPIRARREELAKDPEAVMEILARGTMKGRKKAAETLKEVKRAMKLDYFAS
jgi:tryptophanyl-tRNA synthetase